MATAVVAARAGMQRALEAFESRRRSEIAHVEARRRAEIERARVAETRRREAREALDEEARQLLAARIQALPRGKIIALYGREDGENGQFEAGEIGFGSITPDGRVEILWPNQTRTRTTWPNVSWYAGQPIPDPQGSRGIWREAWNNSEAPSEITTCDFSDSIATHTYISDSSASADFVSDSVSASPSDCSLAVRDATDLDVWGIDMAIDFELQKHQEQGLVDPLRTFGVDSSGATLRL